MGLIPEEIKAVERPDKTEVRLYGGKYRVVPYISLLKNAQIFIL